VVMVGLAEINIRKYMGILFLEVLVLNLSCLGWEKH